MYRQYFHAFFGVSHGFRGCLIDRTRIQNNNKKEKKKTTKIKRVLVRKRSLLFYIFTSLNVSFGGASTYKNVRIFPAYEHERDEIVRDDRSVKNNWYNDRSNDSEI